MANAKSAIIKLQRLKTKYDNAELSELFARGSTDTLQHQAEAVALELAEQLKSIYNESKLKATLSKVVKSSDLEASDVSKSLAKAQEIVAEQTPLSTTLLLKSLKTLAKGIHKPRPTGLLTGLTQLDDVTRGLHAGEVFTLGGRTSIGKTALALKLAYNIADNQANAKDGKQPKVLFVTLEMPAEQLANRIASFMSGVEFKAIQAGGLKPEQLEQLTKAVKTSRANNFTIADEAIVDVAKLRALIHRTKAELVVVDHLHILEADNTNATMTDQIAQLSRSLKLMASELGIALLLVCQLRRPDTTRLNDYQMAGKKNDSDEVRRVKEAENFIRQYAGEQASIYELKNSGSVENDSSVVALINYDLEAMRYLYGLARKEGLLSTYDIKDYCESKLPVNLELVKNRNGLKTVIPLTYTKATQQWGSRGGQQTQAKLPDQPETDDEIGKQALDMFGDKS